MVTKNIRSAFQQALTDFKSVENELNRPEEDIVPLSICFGMRQMMKTLMQLYLSSNKIPYNGKENLGGLFTLCKKADKHFSTVNLPILECAWPEQVNCANNYCLSVEKANECMGVAHKLKGLIQDKLKLKDIE